jgi:hypothetical protein
VKPARGGGRCSRAGGGGSRDGAPANGPQAPAGGFDMEAYRKKGRAISRVFPKVKAMSRKTMAYYLQGVIWDMQKIVDGLNAG